MEHREKTQTAIFDGAYQQKQQQQPQDRNGNVNEAEEQNRGKVGQQRRATTSKLPPEKSGAARVRT